MCGCVAMQLYLQKTVGQLDLSLGLAGHSSPTPALGFQIQGDDDA